MSSSEGPGWVVIVVKGDIDPNSAPRLSAELDRLDTGLGVLVVDLTSVSFIDSSGLTALVVARRRAGDRLRLVVKTGSRIDKLWNICGLDLTFPLYETQEKALAEVVAA